MTPGYEHPGFTTTGVAARVQLPVDAAFYKPKGKAPGGPRLRHQLWRYVDYDGDGALDLVAAMDCILRRKLMRSVKGSSFRRHMDY